MWESRYNILEPKRTPTNIRFYDNHDLKTVLNISVLNEHGYKISKIARMSAEEMTEEVMKLSQEFCHYPDQIQNLTMAMIDMDENRFNRAISININRIGFEHTMTEVVYPFLHRIGILWQTGAINPAQEHFITNLIRQKLMVAIDEHSLSLNGQSKKFVLFLPENELHEIALLFANWLIKRSNHVTFYIGQSTPLGDLMAVCGVVKPDYILGIFSGIADDSQSAEYINALTAVYTHKQLLFTGHFIQKLCTQPNQPFTHMKTVNYLLDLLKELDRETYLSPKGSFQRQTEGKRPVHVKVVT